MNYKELSTPQNLRRRKFASDKEVRSAEHTWFSFQPKNNYFSGNTKVCLQIDYKCVENRLHIELQPECG